MRIVAVLQGLDQPGAAVTTSCVTQLEALALQHRCSLVSDGLAPPGGTQLPVVKLRVPRFRVLRRFAHVPRQVVFILKVAQHLCFQARADSVDLVILHSHPSTALLAPVLRQLKSCKVVMTMHGDIRERPPGTYDPRLTWWYEVNTPAAYRRADAVLALSPNMARLAIDGGASPARVHLTPHGVDAADIGLSNKPRPAIGPGLLFVGRIEYNKGVDLLIEAFCRLAPTRPNLSLTCIGSPDPSYLSELQQQLRATGLTDRVQFLPNQHRQDLGHFYEQAALLVVPSRSEALSTVAIEAMAAGRPVVASDTGGNPLIVTMPHTGLLFTSGDAEALTSALERLVDHPEQRLAMGEAALQDHHARFTRQHAGETLRACIRQIGEQDSLDP